MQKHLTTEQRRKLSVRGALKKKNLDAGKIRLSVNRSNSHIEVQAIDDMAGRTLAAASSKEKGFGGKGYNVAGAELVGAAMAERCKAAGVKNVYFDRGAYRYHGRVQALADAIRKGGVDF